MNNYIFYTMEKYSLEILQDMFPKWNISKNGRFYEFLCEHCYFLIFDMYIDKYINRVKDVYDSIDFIAQFLLENGFIKIIYQHPYRLHEMTYEYTFTEKCTEDFEGNIITEKNKIVISIEYAYYIIYDDIDEAFDSNRFVEKIKEILDIESRNKITI